MPTREGEKEREGGERGKERGREEERERKRVREREKQNTAYLLLHSFTSRVVGNLFLQSSFLLLRQCQAGLHLLKCLLQAHTSRPLGLLLARQVLANFSLVLGLRLSVVQFLVESDKGGESFVIKVFLQDEKEGKEKPMSVKKIIATWGGGGGKEAEDGRRVGQKGVPKRSGSKGRKGMKRTACLIRNTIAIAYSK